MPVIVSAASFCVGAKNFFHGWFCGKLFNSSSNVEEQLQANCKLYFAMVRKNLEQNIT